MTGADFRSRALEEGRRYGGDNYVFVRELAQNARDASATRIDVTTSYKNGQVEMAFRDDGTGMTFAHARRYLFSLYASSKERDAESAGRYGVGFWSVLLFEPNLIEVDSRPGRGEGFAVYLSGDLAHDERGACPLRSRGTRVRLVKRLDERDGLRACTEIERALVRHCSHLRRNDRAHTPLPVYLNGLRIDAPFGVDGPCWMSFSDGPVEGVVGLGAKPRVELYARGLLVWRGATIDELRYGVTPSLETAHPEGLAPVYVLNGNRLSVTMDRRAVVDDAALDRLRRVARRRMRELVRRYLDTVARRPWTARVADAVAALGAELSGSGRVRAAALALGVAACVAAAGFAAFPSLERALSRGDGAVAPAAAGGGESVAPRPSYAPLARGASYDGPLAGGPPAEGVLPLVYAPPSPMRFRTAAIEELDARRGAVAPPPAAVAAAPAYACASGCVRVRVSVSSGPGLLPIPVPTGHAVEAAGVRLDGRPAGILLLTAAGDPVLPLTSARTAGVLDYTTGPLPGDPGPERARTLTEIPADMAFPKELEEAAARAALGRTTAEKVAAVVGYVTRAFAYDGSPSAAEAFRRFSQANPRAGWLGSAAALGRGDCDVGNTVAVALLRRAGVPSRLAIGFAGEAGAAVPGMHAWTEYYDGGLRAADATPPRDPGRSAVGGPSPAPGEAGAPVAARAARDRPPGEPRRPLARIAALAAAAAAAAALFVVVLLLASGRARKLTVPRSPEDRRRIAAGMLLSSFTSPDVWLRGSGLDGRPLLPVLGNCPPLALDEARRMGERGDLWFSKGATGLAKRAAAGGARILDAADPVFGEIAPRIPGAQDLDAVAKLSPAEADALPEDHRAAGRLIEEAGRLLELGGVGPGFARCCTGIEGGWVRDVDLRGIGLRPTRDLPSRFIAVSPSHPTVTGLAARTQRAPGLGAFLLLDAILGESGMLARRGERIRRAAAAAVLEEAG